MTTAQSNVADRSQLGPQWLFLVILAGLGMVGPFSIDTMFPAFVRMGAEWGASELALQQIVSVYLLAFAVMSLVHGPLSDALGRKPVILAGTALYIVASIGCALAPSLPVLLVFRAVQGLSAGAGAIISRAMVRDVFSDAEAQRTMSHIAMIFGLAPALAPVAGGLLLGWTGWRGIFWALAVLGALLLVLVFWFMPETHPAENRSSLKVRELGRSLADVLRDQHGRRLAFTAMFNNGAMFLYISSAPLLVVNLLHLGETDFWILFVPMISGMVFGSWVSGRLAGRMTGSRLATLGYRISLVAAATNLVLTLIPATRGLPWTILPLPVLTFGIALAFPVLTLAMLDLFPNSRGSASSIQNFLALMGNALISAIVAPMLGVSLVWLATGSLVLLVCSALLWMRHLSVAPSVPQGPTDAVAYEPIDEI
ncbi:MAG TPA: multidrug effflux MFS transporter [Propionicimonas sp.]|nr:multidrug effflux MFS transporter [Propionicimonas sp.]HRA06107.1 multidrug effflux MFS transporter [Propionicimonas sp.]